MCNTSRDIIRYFTAVASEDAVHAKCTEDAIVSSYQRKLVVIPWYFFPWCLRFFLPHFLLFCYYSGVCFFILFYPRYLHTHGCIMCKTHRSCMYVIPVSCSSYKMEPCNIFLPFATSSPQLKTDISEYINNIYLEHNDDGNSTGSSLATVEQ